jgi:hypothetical protein
MTTKAEIIATLKLKYPEIKIGGGDVYETLSPADYETKILEWADYELANEAKAEAEATSEADKAGAKAKLAALGLTTDDLKALGL